MAYVILNVQTCKTSSHTNVNVFGRMPLIITKIFHVCHSHLLNEITHLYTGRFFFKENYYQKQTSLMRLKLIIQWLWKQMCSSHSQQFSRNSGFYHFTMLRQRRIIPFCITCTTKAKYLKHRFCIKASCLSTFECHAQNFKLQQLKLKHILLVRKGRTNYCKNNDR